MTDGDAADGALVAATAGLILVTLAALPVVVYAAAWGVDSLLAVPLASIRAVARLTGTPPFVAALLLGAGGFGLVVVHEAVHAASYVAFGGISWRGVGATVRLFSPVYDPVRVYVYPTEPIQPRAYLLGVAMPGVVTGLLPAGLGVATGSPLLLVVGTTGIVLAYIDVGVLVSAWLGPTPLGR